MNGWYRNYKVSFSRSVLGYAVIVFSIRGITAENRLLSQDKEKLLFEEIPVVITASRKVRPITEAPVTIRVIDPEDIRYSGAAAIPVRFFQTVSGSAGGLL